MEVAVALGGGCVHDGAVEPIGNQGFGGLGTEVAQEHHQGVDAIGLHVLDSLLGLDLVLHSNGTLVEAIAAGGCQSGPPALRQRGGKAGAADGDNAQLDLGDVLKHNFFLHFYLFPYNS